MSPRLASKDTNGRSKNDASASECAFAGDHESSVRLDRIMKFHRPEYKRDGDGVVDEQRMPICTGCEVNFWPCATVKLARGEWDSIPE